MADSSTTRSFQSGRQSEQLYNEELWNNYESTRHLLDIPEGRATNPGLDAIDGALWLDRNLNELKSFSKTGGSWNTIFGDKFKLVDQITSQLPPDNPVLGQLWLQNNILLFYDGATWTPVRTAPEDGTTISMGMFDNFYLASPLEKAKNTVVPESELDKLDKHVKDSAQTIVDNFKNRFSPSLIQDMPDINNIRLEGKSQYLVPNILLDRIYVDGELDHGYESPNNISVEYPNTYLGGKQPALVHVNPDHLSKITKRIFVIDKESGKIDVSTADTEFYAFKKGNPYGKFLAPARLDKAGDYEPLVGQIYLNEHIVNEYDLIVAVTYQFNWYRGNGTMSHTDSNDKTTSYYVNGYQAETAFFVEGVALDDTSYKMDAPSRLVTFTDDTTNMEIAAMHTTHQEHGIIEKLDADGKGIIKLKHKTLTPLVCVDGVALQPGNTDPLRPYHGDYTIDQDKGIIRVDNVKEGSFWLVVELYDWKYDYNMFLESGKVDATTYKDNVPIIEYNPSGREGDSMELFVDGILIKKEDVEYLETNRKTVIPNMGITVGDDYGVIKKSVLADKKRVIQDVDIYNRPVVHITDEQANRKDYKFIQNDELVERAEVIQLAERCIVAEDSRDDQSYDLMYDKNITKTSGTVSDLDIYNEAIIKHDCKHRNEKMLTFIDGFLVDNGDLDVGRVADATIYCDNMHVNDNYKIFVGRSADIERGTIEKRDASNNAVIPLEKKINDEIMQNLAIISNGHFIDSKDIHQTTIDERCIVAEGMEVGQRFALVECSQDVKVETGDVGFNTEAGKVCIPLRYGINDKFLSFVDGLLVYPSEEKFYEIHDTQIIAPAMMKGGDYSMLTQKQTAANTYVADSTHGIIISKDDYERVSKVDERENYVLCGIDDEELIDTKVLIPEEKTYEVAEFDSKYSLSVHEGELMEFYCGSAMLDIYHNNDKASDRINELAYNISRSSEWNPKDMEASLIQEMWLLDGELVPLTQPDFLEALVYNKNDERSSLLTRLNRCSTCLRYRGGIQYMGPIFYEKSSNSGDAVVAKSYRVETSDNTYVLTPMDKNSNGMQMIRNSMVFADGQLVDPNKIVINEQNGTIYFPGLNRDTQVMIAYFTDGSWASAPITDGRMIVPNDQMPLAYIYNGHLIPEGYTINADNKVTDYRIVLNALIPGKKYLFVERSLFDANTRKVQYSKENGAGIAVENGIIYGDFYKCFLLYNGKHILPKNYETKPFDHARKFLEVENMQEGEKYTIAEFPETVQMYETYTDDKGRVDITPAGWNREQKLQAFAWIDGTFVAGNEIVFDDALAYAVIKDAAPGQHIFFLTDQTMNGNFGNIPYDSYVKGPAIRYTNYVDEDYIGNTLLFVDGLIVEKDYQVIQHLDMLCLTAAKLERHKPYMMFNKQNFHFKDGKVDFFNPATRRYEVDHVVPHEDGYELLFILEDEYRNYTVDYIREDTQISIPGLRIGQSYTIIEGEHLDIINGVVAPLGNTQAGVVRYGVMKPTPLTKEEFESGVLFIDGVQVDNEDIEYHDDDGDKYFTVKGDLKKDQQFTLVRNLATNRIKRGKLEHDLTTNMPLVRFDQAIYTEDDLKKFMCLFIDGTLADATEQIRPDSGYAYTAPDMHLGAEYYVLNSDDFENTGKVQFKDTEGQLGIEFDYAELDDDAFRVLLNNKLLTSLEFMVKKIRRLAITTPGLKLGQEYILLQDKHGQLHDSTDISSAQPVGRFSESMVFINNKLIMNSNPFITHKTEDEASKTAASGEILAFTMEGDRDGSHKRFKYFDSYNQRWVDMGDEGTQLNKMLSSYENVTRAIQYSDEFDQSVTNDDHVDIFAYKYASMVDTPLHIGTILVSEVPQQFDFETDEKFITGIGALSVWVNGIRQYDVTEKTDGSGFDLSTPVVGRISYVIATPDDGQSVVCEREVLTENNIVPTAVNTYKTTKSMYPGRVVVYIDGLRQPKSAYTIIDNKTLLIQADQTLVGNAGTLPEHKVMVNGEVKTVKSDYADRIMVEVHRSINRNEACFELDNDDLTYINLDKYHLTDDLLNTEDEILIFVDGMFMGLDSETGYALLDSERMIQINNVLDDSTNTYVSTLGVDPLHVYLSTHPEARLAYKAAHGGQDYVPGKKWMLLEWT